ncbi:MutS-related protein [Oceanotoga teriensis]|jgi:DNA mismatch repair ATPase MutS|uniref:MutS-like protein n=1 Tax=Oceanotoga teriensis TaxID=515440 RepID=A0AA45HJF4_9BACT|nr:DNA mismatch repair protein MutS [Oceanotoga teriensis]MDO7976956.1 DNA mismatch repair protein MutS [Oceanotoga teriensis]PWJ95742.1 MutS-like protein [Oceanotoga teriensis]
MYKNKEINFILKDMNLYSPIGCKYIEKLKFMTNIEDIENEYERIEIMRNYIKNINLINPLKVSLSHIKDIENTIYKLSDSNLFFNDIELFEIKNFCIYCEEIYNLKIDSIENLFPKSTKNLINLLDPEKYGLNSFYIYNSYSEDLKELRKKKKIFQIEGKENEEAYLNLLYEESKLEDLIRKKLTDIIRKDFKILKENFEKISYLDYLIAKTELIEKKKFVRPRYSKNNTVYKGLFNPRVLDILKNKNKNYQSIDVNINHKLNIIMGANMTGKTVFLKSLAISQYLFQYGFYVPAENACLDVYDDIVINIGDSQNIEKGLSSYASEILKINEALKRLKKGEKLFIIFDEFARTTNPEEGVAIINGTLKTFYNYNCTFFLSTHYSGINYENVDLFTVKGLKKDILNLELKANEIEKYIDYSILKIEDEKMVSKDAINIAKILGVDEELIFNSIESLE